MPDGYPQIVVLTKSSYGRTSTAATDATGVDGVRQDEVERRRLVLLVKVPTEPARYRMALWREHGRAAAGHAQADGAHLEQPYVAPREAGWIEFVEQSLERQLKRCEAHVDDFAEAVYETLSPGGSPFSPPDPAGSVG